jgi:riboflavin kinase
MDELLLFLLKKGAHRSALGLTTSDIGADLGMSQQNVSRKLRLLEDEGKITRERSGIRISEQGVLELKELQASLENAFSANLEIVGRIVDGLGEGKFYLSQDGYRKQIKGKLGFDPYPGTLNIRIEKDDVEKRRRLLALDPLIIEGFVKEGRRFGDLLAYLADVEGRECAILVPLRTHHGSDVLEIAASVNLKKELGKNNGDQITISL